LVLSAFVFSEPKNNIEGGGYFYYLYNMEFICDSVKYNRKEDAIGTVFVGEELSTIIVYDRKGHFYEISIMIDEDSDIIVED
jgi:hypothetical protein